MGQTVRVPFERLDIENDGTIGEAAQEELRRNWDEISKAFGNVSSSPSYDCFVDPKLAADDVKNLKFKTIASAVNTMYAKGFTGTLRIGFIPNATNTSAQDQALITTAPSNLFIQVIGTNIAPWNIEATTIQATWDWNSKAHPLNRLVCDGIQINNTTFTTVGGTWTTTGSFQGYFHNCLLDGGAQANATSAGRINPGNNDMFFDNCYIRDMVVPQSGGTGIAWFRHCLVQANICSTLYGPWGNGVGSGNAMVFTDCQFQATGGGAAVVQWSFQSDSIIIQGGSYGANGWGLASAGNVPSEFAFPAAGSAIYVDMDSSLSRPTSTGHVGLNVSSGAASVCVIKGNYRYINIPAPRTVGSQQRTHSITATCELGCDVTGPAQVNIASSQTTSTGVTLGLVNNITIRGKNVVGSVRAAVGVASATAISFVGATECVISAGVDPIPTFTPSSNKSYNFDAASSRNVLIIAGTNAVGAGADAGTNNLIITEAGVPSTGLPDIITAGGPTGDATHVPIITWDAKGRLTAVSSAVISGGPPSGAAGGSLAGTYPNPTFAGRDASVDALVKDMTQAFLVMGG